MPCDYNPSAVESKWQKKWEEARVYNTDLQKAKNPYYSLVMFPYPSGDKLHVGHWYNFAPADSWSRFMKMQGNDVFAPMGFDAFGLPAENYAIKTGIHPSKSIHDNVQTMIAQLKRMGCMYDWEKTVNTSLPEYYRWTQWVFLQMYEHGLSYKKLGNVNYCPKDQTVLANEQVQDGKCERCGTEVVQKQLNQWFWNIRMYAQRLIDNLDTLDWPEKTKAMQRNWIGRSEGAEVEFAIHGHEETLKVFTTRPDTLFGVTYMVLAPDHPLVDTITTPEHGGSVRAYREQTRKKTELQRTDLNKEKSGVPTGAFAVNPVNRKKIPIWIGDYVLMTYGTGAIMAVPGHDERDHAFAQAFDLPILEVVEGQRAESGIVIEGTAINSDFLDGLKTHEAKKKMIAWLEDNDKGREVINFCLRDWLISRQRYWGAPIPIVYDPEGKPHPIPEEHLPWLLPTDVEFRPTGESPLKHSKEFKERTEKIFGKGWTPEYDTMDTFVCSSFYYLRYLAPQEAPDELRITKDEVRKKGSTRPLPIALRTSLPVDPAIEKKWMPVDMYIGGPEHACMHLIYARFVMMALKDFGFVSHEEPFQKLVHQGLITNKGAKMSKSKGNVVSPDSFVDEHGSDVFRMYLMFMGPFTDGGDWSDTGIKGIDRFVQRVWKLFSGIDNKKGKEDKDFVAMLHRTIKKVTDSIGVLHFNTAISALMEFLNEAEKTPVISIDTAQVFVRLLAPLAPHLAEELWSQLGGKGFAIEQSWPAFDPALIKTATVTIAVQVNGKVRGQIEVASDASEKEVLKAAREQENVQKYLEGKTPKKEIYVKGRLVSLVV